MKNNPDGGKKKLAFKKIKYPRASMNKMEREKKKNINYNFKYGLA